MSRIALLLLVGASLGLAAAGCGGGGSSGAPLSKDEYESRMQALQKELSSFGSAFENLSDPAELTDALREGADLLDEAAGKLEDIEPPDEIREAHERLAPGARAVADFFREVSDRLEKAKLAELPEIVEELNPAENEALKGFQEAIEEIRSKGYEIGGNG